MFHLGPDGLLHYIHDFITKDKSEFCVDSYEEEESTDSYNPIDFDYNVRDLERNNGKVGRSKSKFLNIMLVPNFQVPFDILAFYFLSYFH